MPDNSWLEKAKNTHKIHAANLRNNQGWTIEKTAKSLGRSIGNVSEDLMIARWWKIHPNKIEKMAGYKECLEWIRDKNKEMEQEDIA